ncbi:MAG: hypothetical protein ACOCSQ_02615 [Planctomycetota bacterium]
MIIPVAFGVGALVVYFKGAKKDKPWAKPLMTLLVLGAVVSVILPRTRAWREMTRPRVEKHQAIRMMGDVLKDQLPDNPRVLVIRYQIDPEMEMMEMPSGDEEDMPTQEEMREERKAEVKEAFEKGFGKKVEIVGYEPPGLTEEYLEEGETAAEFNRVIAEYEDDDVDLLISAIGLPRDRDGNIELDELTISDLGSDVLFFADIGLQYDPDELRSFIEDDLLDGAVIHPSTRSPERRVITSDTLKDLPEEPPIER